MRQNLKSIEHSILKKEKKSILHYGLTINVELGEFDISNLILTNNNFDVQISAPKVVKITNHVLNSKDLIDVVKFESEIGVQNEFDKFHKNNIKEIKIIEVPKNQKIQQPIIINTLVQSKNTIQQMLFKIGENSVVTIINILNDKTTDDGYNGRLINIEAGKGSKINYINIQNLNKKKVHYEKNISIARKSSNINIEDFSMGGNISISEIKTILKESGARAKILEVFFSSDNQQFDIKGEAIHKSKETFSDLLAKGVIKNSSKSLYRGNIHIQKPAFNSQGFQKSEMLMIDEEGQADAIPQLLIDNNEVKCSHAVAIGKINEDKLFYFMSRGISEKEAKNKIIKGFLESTIQDLDETIKLTLIKTIEEKMKL